MKGLVLDAQWEPGPDYAVSEWEKETGKAITGSSVWRHPRLEVSDWPDPTPGPKDVVLEVQACGVCGSDMHFYETDDDDYILYPGLTKFPTILGHEFSGKVVEVGAEVKLLQVGDMVTVEEMIWCGRCNPCRNGYPNHCTNLEELGFTIPGAFANYIAVDEKFCWPINAINAKVVQIGRAARKVPMYLEAFQVRRSQVYGAQGHSGHETFPNVIRMVAAGRLDLSPIVTARYGLEATVDAIVKSIDRADGKIMVRPD